MSHRLFLTGPTGAGKKPLKKRAAVLAAIEKAAAKKVSELGEAHSQKKSTETQPKRGDEKLEAVGRAEHASNGDEPEAAVAVHNEEEELLSAAAQKGWEAMNSRERTVVARAAWRAKQEEEREYPRRRPLTAYGLWSASLRHEAEQESVPFDTSGDCGTLPQQIWEQWRSLPAEDKQRWEDRAAEGRAEYAKKIDEIRTRLRCRDAASYAN
eukprot:Hpha_TRINITY_DN30598_c0_g1::TRINITY_DN30598_c0_g1_i1::g.193740::m.193740